MREETLVRNLLAHQRVIEAMITAMVGDPVAAEDLFQEVAVVMTRRREEAGEDCRFVAWARAIAVNVVRDHRKRLARRKVRLMDDAALEGVALVFEEAADGEWDGRRDALRRCAEKLPERDRFVLRRRYEEAAPADVVARELSTTRGAVDTLLYRLRKALHACVEGRLGKAGPA